jgi:hypothetical protein
VLVIGSGFTTHGLPFLSRSDFLGHTLPGWSTADRAAAGGDRETWHAARERGHVPASIGPEVTVPRTAGAESPYP